MRRFVVIGQKAIASDEFLLDDLPGTSGRLDVLVRCLRAALLSSHGVRRDVIAYLVLLGGARAPRVVRVEGATVQFLRPDERALAVLMRKVLASTADESADGFVVVKPGISVARGGLEAVLNDARAAATFVLDGAAADIRDATTIAAPDVLFVIGDHLGLSPESEHLLAQSEVGAQRISIGPMQIHADDVVAVVTNELDRRSSP